MSTIMKESDYMISIEEIDTNINIMCCKLDCKGSKNIRRINDTILNLLTNWIWVNPFGDV